MTKTYRLKKWYPSLNKDWKVGMEVGIGDYSTGLYSPCSANYSEGKIIPSHVERNSEFWEEIVEKDYEILEFRSKTVKGKYFKDNVLFDFLSDEWEIYKVKRLSDGAIFSLGDKVQTTDKEFKGVIEEIEIHSDKSLAFLFPTNMVNGKIFIALHLLEPYKQPILITEDGVELFEGDKVFGVCIKGSWETRDTFVNSAMLFLQNKHKEQSAWLYFSTKEKALEYIDLNKPRFSKKEVLSALELTATSAYVHGSSFGIVVGKSALQL